ncbi:MAG: hypothetical protein ACHQNV_10350 [Vicinamibacteria bacterium]
MTLAIFVSVFVGFARSFFLRPLFPTWPSPHETIFYVHGALFTAWFVLLIVQASLVAAGRTDTHRKLGRWGVALAASMVVLGILGALIAARRPTGFVGIPVPGLRFLAIPFFDMLLFSSFVATAIVKRGDPQAHKRWMLLASIELLTAAIARWPVVMTTGALPLYFGLTDLFLVPIVIWDLVSRRRVHSATLWGGLLLIVSQPLRLVVSGTAAWLAFARWATGLLG